MALGFPHPRYLQQVLTSQDVTDWKAYEIAEGFGSVRDDWRMGTLAALTYNASRERGASAKAWYDFFPNASMPGGLPPLQSEVEETQRSIEENNRRVEFLFGIHNRVIALREKREVS